ncbi:hypothetical protein E1262_11865 [Jiangella aurantiaca]|uniref:Uncharacterized protein n=1 Tax=Jiangella aurantiaca TaxID=2530373 RepID=A0A4R5AEB9_9ACTN|nr:hypothetical protein [Jiangella aurantiaca]TDD69646.1 hypothetical protein E1262_11865 [Jiangella aurantiaca]
MAEQLQDQHWLGDLITPKAVSRCEQAGPVRGQAAGRAGTVAVMRTYLAFMEPARVAGRVEA